MTTYVAFDDNAIWGWGNTKEAALEHVAQITGWKPGKPTHDFSDDTTAADEFYDELKVIEATPKLAALCETVGCERVGVLKDGRACTGKEMDEEDAP